MDVTNLVISGLLAATCPAAAWVRTWLAGPPRTGPARAREAAWCAGLAACALGVMSLFDGFAPAHWPGSLAVLGVAWALAVARPRLAFGLVPPVLACLGGYGLVVARDYGFWGWRHGSYLLLPVGGYDLQYYLVLPLAYALLALAGWLAWRAADHESPAASLLLGRLAARPGAAPPYALALLPAAAWAGGLCIPNTWLGSGLAGPAWTLLILAATLAAIRWRPERAAAAAAVAAVLLGLVSLIEATSWTNLAWPQAMSPGGYPGLLPRPPNGYILDGPIAISSQPLADLAIGQSVLLIMCGLWLARQTIPGLPRLLGWASTAELASRVQRLTESRAVAVDTAAADLRRLERDLHDGTQARLVALGMNLRTVERLIPASPDAALALLAEARQTSARALTELRELVRGVHPPVLADRGLADALRALALDTPLRVDTDIDLPGQVPAPVETACYFAVAEILTNAVKHSGSRTARISAAHAGGTLRIMVTDFGLGGADPGRGTGLAGVEKRLAAFDGILAVSSPVGGPTMVVLEIPCALSSPKTSSC